MWFLVKKSGVCAVKYASVIMFTRATEREKSSDSNFEIRESDQKIFLLHWLWVGVDENKRTHFSKIWSRGWEIFQTK
jgi:hypothetical protein